MVGRGDRGGLDWLLIAVLERPVTLEVDYILYYMWAIAYCMHTYMHSCYTYSHTWMRLFQFYIVLAGIEITHPHKMWGFPSLLGATTSKLATDL